MIFDLFGPSRERAAGDLFDDRYWTTASEIGRRSSSGTVITPETALTLDAYFACIRNIAEDMAKLPFDVVEKNADRSKTPRPDTACHRLMNVAPNPAMTPQAFRESLTGQALGWGNGYAEIVYDGRGNPIEVWPIHPSRVTYEVQESGRVLYTVYSPNGSKVELDQRYIYHLPGFGGDGIGGYALAALAANTIGLGVDQEKSAGSSMKNGSRLSGIVTPNGVMNKEALNTFQKSWNSQFGGSENTGKVAALPYDMKFSPISMPAAEAQLVEQRRLTVESVARWLRMPPHKLAEMSNATFNNIEHQDISYVRDTLMAWDARWHDECKRKLLGLDNNLFGRHNFDLLLRGDTETRYKSHQISMNAGFKTRNEVRAEEDLPPIEGGDQVYVPLNMAPLGEDGKPEIDRAAMPNGRPPANRSGGTINDTQRDPENTVDLTPIITATAERLVINETNALSRQKPGYDQEKFKERVMLGVQEAFRPIAMATRLEDCDMFAVRIANDYIFGSWSADHTPDERRERLISIVKATFGITHASH